MFLLSVVWRVSLLDVLITQLDNSLPFFCMEQGVLTNGKTVAVKRLFFNTKQWVDHFFNEVNLISQIEHKNLVKLLGCSITGPESLLVYEYIANQSLHDYLFGLFYLIRNLLFLRLPCPDEVILSGLTAFLVQ